MLDTSDLLLKDICQRWDKRCIMGYLSWLYNTVRFWYHYIPIPDWSAAVKTIDSENLEGRTAIFQDKTRFWMQEL